MASTVLALVSVAVCMAPNLALADETQDTMAALQEQRLENKKLIAENLALKDKLAAIEGRTTFLNNVTQAQETYIVEEVETEEGIVMLVIILMVFLWALPLVILKRCCETRKHRVIPLVTIVNLVIISITMWNLPLVEFNDLFFAGVKIIEFVLASAEDVLFGIAALVGMLVAWKFKDRLLEALGVENPELLTGQFQDWMTCWSMRRFHPLEMFIWKAENLPAGNSIQNAVDVFCEVTNGYNANMRTRVHRATGNSCVFKESVQFNFDPFDRSSKMTVTFQSQDLLGGTELCSVQLSAARVERLTKPMEQTRTIGWGSSSAAGGANFWVPQRFEAIDLVPKGKVYVLFSPVPVEDEGAGDTFWSCCCPKRRADATPPEL